MSLKRIIFLTVIILSGFNAHAQFSDSVNHYINYTANGLYNKTNDGKSYVLTNSLRFNVRKKSLHLNSTNSYTYGRQQQRKTNNDFTSTLDFNLFKTLPHFYYWGLAAYDRSYSLKINNRLQTGLGVAYNVFDKPTIALNISDGILYETSNLQLNDSTKSINNIFRNSFRLRYKFTISKIVVIDGINFWQNSLEDRSDYIIQSINTISVKLRKWLALNTSANYNSVQRTHRENLFITFGLTAEKYF